MVQWVNRLRNNIFINPPPLPLLCEISGALHLGRQAGWLADEIQVNSKLAVGRNIQLVASFNQGTSSLQPYQCWFFGIGNIFQKPYDFVPIPTIKYYRNMCMYIYIYMYMYICISYNMGKRDLPDIYT